VKVDTKAILEFSAVELADTLSYETGLAGVELSLMPGELVLVHTRPGYRRLPLADAAAGLLRPTDGQVAFLGKNWELVGPDETARLRGRIGRVFEGAAWVNNLDLDENITLRPRHHTRRTLADIVDEAANLARTFGFESLPTARPAWMEPEALRRAQWVRALLDSPELLLLEFPEAGVARDFVTTFYRALRTALAGGAAALWVTANAALFEELGLTVDREYTIVGGHWRLFRKSN